MNKINIHEAEEILNIILENAELDGFAYSRDTYSLRFNTSPNAVYKEQGVPFELTLNVQSTCRWRIGTEQDWEKNVSELYREDLTEPTEPIFSFALSALLWDKKYGGTIEKVVCDENFIKFILMKDREIFIQNESEYADNIWMLWGLGKSSDDAEWLLAWNNFDKYIFRCPLEK